MADHIIKPLVLTVNRPITQATVTTENDRVKAVLPTGESIEVLLHGATVISWKDASGDEKLWLSESAVLDGSKPVRGGIPLVFPVFGKSDYHRVSSLPQHGFARTSRWEFLGKSTSESSSNLASSGPSVKLDFGLSSSSFDEATRKLWPYEFAIIYGVTLERNNLTTTLVITNKDKRPYRFHALTHTYLRVKDVTKVSLEGLEGSKYIDKVGPEPEVKEQSSAITITGETDRVYTPDGIFFKPVQVLEGGKPVMSITRDNLPDVVVWNPWADKAGDMADFAPKDGYKNMLCVETGTVREWQFLEPGDGFHGSQTIRLL